MKIEEIELCLDMHYKTEIVATHRMDPALGEDLSYTVARGRPEYGGSLTVRPMIQVLAAGSGSCFPMQQVPCADCGDFSRSWNCEAHVGDEDDDPGLAGFDETS